MLEGLVYVGALLAVAALLVGAAMWVSSASCTASWQDSGHAVRWAPIQGCQIQVDGAWLPADKYRVLS